MRDFRHSRCLAQYRINVERREGKIARFCRTFVHKITFFSHVINDIRYHTQITNIIHLRAAEELSSRIIIRMKKYTTEN